ncbi:MAG TPA: FAD-dependent oxidoreductase [Rubrobacteraceae bacterium]|nr:FAD-dependent oxidoreductase [Rubrobacteraceae bacterium]
MNENERLVIVGGGPGGFATARAYRAAGGRARVTMLTTEPYPPYQRPPLTKEYLRGEMGLDELPIQNPEWYGKYGIELRLAARVKALDRERTIVETEEGEIRYDACVLATGSEPVRIPVPGADDPEILVMRTLENSSRLQERLGEGDRVAVIGSGFIGCEAAASLSVRGAKVTLVSLEQSPQKERLGEEVGGRIEDWLRGYGVDLRLGSSIEGVERKDGVFEVSVEGGEQIPADTVLFGTGVSPRTDLAERAGLAVEKGIITDSAMRTSGTGIFAVGDVAQAFNESAGRRLSVEHWGDALEHGRVAGTVIAGGEAAWSMAPGFWSTIGDKTLKYWAWGDGWDEKRFVDRGESFTVWYGREGSVVGVLAHGSDEDYEEGRALIESGAPLRR